jgi:protein TonB
MIAFAIEDAGADLRRWVFSGAAVVLAHAGIATAMVHWRDPPETTEPAAAIVIEFAPVPIGPTTPMPEMAPGPEQVMSDASPANPVESREEKDEEKIEQKIEARLDERFVEENEFEPSVEPPPDVATAPNPEVVLALPPPQREELKDKQDSSQRQEPRAPAPTTSAPQLVPEATAALPAAPEQGPLTPQNSSSIQGWQRQVVTLLERNKRYPPAAQARRQQGVAQLFFSLDRQGRVTESRVLRSSGAATLDQEALALLRRAQPFPPPPPELTGDRVGLTVPVRFNLK